MRARPGYALARYAIVGSVVGVYVALGFLLHPGTNGYLLLGIPITVAFQVCIARRPLRELWLRDGQPLRADGWSAALAAILLVGPIMAIAAGLRTGAWTVTVYGLAAIAGAAGAALAFRVLGARYLWQLGLLALVVIPIGLLRVIVIFTLAHGGAGLQHLDLAARAWTAVRSLLFYIPAVFVAEEVFFRGALDSYLHRYEQGPGWGSAAAVSVLWGLWHLPIAGPLSWVVVAEIVAAQLFLGLILSWFWRQSGNLAVPGTIHAIVDALRNAVLM